MAGVRGLPWLSATAWARACALRSVVIKAGGASCILQGCSAASEDIQAAHQPGANKNRRFERDGGRQGQGVGAAWHAACQLETKRSGCYIDTLANKNISN